MQLGFTFLEVGSVRVQFTKSILMKNMVDMIISAIMYFAVGFGFAFGDGSSSGGLIGSTNFFLSSNQNASDIHHSSAGWVYHWSYCATAATIVAGAIAERTQLVAYGVYSIIGSTLLYPVITHWIWSPTGWASALNPNSLIAPVLDDAGGIAVHTCAGMCSIVACFFVGPRQHRLDRKGNFVKDLPKQNQSFIVFGMFVLWFSWYAFNAGPAILAAASNESLMGNIAAYTTICAASSGATYLALSVGLRKKLPEPGDLCNGILAGLVCSTSGCSVIKPYFGIVIGSLGGVIVMVVSKLMRRFRIDDVVDAVAVHLGCGVWSALSAPLFAETVLNTDEGLKYAYKSCGVFTGCSEGWKYLGSNVLLTLLTIIYVTAIVTPTCFILRQCKILRIKVESERHGVDIVEFEGPAYNNDMKSRRSKLFNDVKHASPRIGMPHGDGTC
ncbi:ammonium transporter 2-like isoform X3 [Bolinopsis microptera]